MENDRGVSAVLSTVRQRDYIATDLSAADLVAAKGSRRVSVCLPARDEAQTVGAIVGAVFSALTVEGGGLDLVDEILVIDDQSADATAEIAERAGARVLPATGPVPGKGQAMRNALDACTGDLVCFLDADVESFGPHYVVGLLAPLLLSKDVALVKGFYERPLYGQPTGGGRVTELMARPVLELLFPDLSGIRQPLAGETAGPRSVFEKVGLADGYGVELALLIDVADQFGVEAIAQVDLGVRSHRNRPLEDLRLQAVEILQVALGRAGVTTPPPR
jgi:glucosyl-3-phosphoglycerate synthase